MQNISAGETINNLLICSAKQFVLSLLNLHIEGTVCKVKLLNFFCCCSRCFDVDPVRRGQLDGIPTTSWMLLLVSELMMNFVNDAASMC
jgi:hypothetical protein